MRKSLPLKSGPLFVKFMVGAYRYTRVGSVTQRFPFFARAITHMDFPITLDLSSKVTLWKQLSAALTEAILTGRLRPGENLPPTRALAQLLSVSRDTVVRAYDELTTQGYVEGSTRAGTRVRNSIMNARAAEAKTQIESRMRATDQVEQLSRYAERLIKIEPAGATSFDQPALNFGAPPAEHLPGKQWREILARHAVLQDTTRLVYDSELFGHRPLREAIASFLRRSKALNCTSDQIVVFSDSQQAFDLIARILLNEGDQVVLENPGYGGARENLMSHGAVIHPISIDEHGMVTDELASVPQPCKLVHATPAHHDPTGVVMSLERRQKLLQWARQAGAFIIEDAFDSDFRYGSQPMPALQSLDQTDSVIYLYSFWKVLYPITTAGCMVLPPPLVDVFARAKVLIKRNFPIVEHYVLTEYINEGHLERHIRKMRAIYERRRQKLIYALAQNFRTAVTYYKESAGLHLLVRFNHDVTDGAIVESAARAGLPIASTRPYYVENPVAGEFLSPFASISEDQIEQKVEDMANHLSGRLGLATRDQGAAMGFVSPLQWFSSHCAS